MEEEMDRLKKMKMVVCLLLAWCCVADDTLNRYFI